MSHSLRIVHTSDWHLGHTLNGQSREHEHHAFLDWLLDRLEELEADALLVAGDLFHTSNPSAAAKKTFFDFLATLRRRLPDLTPVLIGGNHDSAAQLDAPNALLRALGVEVVGGMRWSDDGYDAERAVIPITRGEEVAAWVCAVPFLRRSDLDPAMLRDRGHAGAVEAAYGAVLAHAADRRSAGQPLIAMGHGTLVGGRLSSDSERRVVRGGEEALPVELFGDEVSYVALGHLHLAQAVGGLDHVRYSGSPIPLAMSEESYEHQVLVVDFDGAELTGAESLRVPRAVPLMRFRYAEPLSIDETIARLEALEVADRPLHERPFLEVNVLVDRAEPNLVTRIREAVADLPVRLVSIKRSRPETDDPTTADDAPTQELSDLAPVDVFRMMHERDIGTEPRDVLLRAFAELEQRVAEAV